MTSDPLETQSDRGVTCPPIHPCAGARHRPVIILPASYPAEAQCIRIVMIGEFRLATASRVRSVIRRAQDNAREVICDLGDLSSVDALARTPWSMRRPAPHNGVRLTIVAQPAACPPGSSGGSGSTTPLGWSTLPAAVPARPADLASGQRSRAIATASRIVRPRFQRATRSRPRGRRPPGRDDAMTETQGHADARLPTARRARNTNGTGRTSTARSSSASWTRTIPSTCKRWSSGSCRWREDSPRATRGSRGAVRRRLPGCLRRPC